jgi:hypothetical protein
MREILKGGKPGLRSNVVDMTYEVLTGKMIESRSPMM